MFNLITPAELLLYPTGLDWQSIAESIGSVDEPAGSIYEVIEQTEIIKGASELVANYCNMPYGLAASTQTETAAIARVPFYGSKCWVDLNGYLNFKTENLPVINVTNIQYAIPPAPLSWVAYSPLAPMIHGRYPQFLRIKDTTQDWSWAKFGCYIQITYTAGWPNASISSSVTAGSNVIIPVDASLGASVTNSMNPEMQAFQNTLTIYDAATNTQETVTVTAVPDATHIQVATLANNHAAGVRISSIPQDIKTACILYATHLGRERGVTALSMPSGRSLAAKGGDELMSDAEFLLEPFVVKN